MNPFRIAILICLYVLLSAHGEGSKIPDLAYVIEGEAADCPIEAKLAVAYMYQRGAKFNGWRQPSDQAIAISLRWYDYDDPSLDPITGDPAWSIFSDEDLQLGEVQEILAQPAKRWVRTFECKGSNVHLYT